MLLYVCVSSHGFGHGSRTAAVLTELAALRPDWRLVLSTALPPGFLQLALGPVAHEIRPCRWDVGVVQADALAIDPGATLQALQELETALPAQLEREIEWLRQQHEPVLVLADVPPAAALLAGRIGAPLVWLASFGWDAIYAPMGGAFLEWAERSRALYARGDLLLRCPLSLPMNWGIPALDLGLTCGRPRLEPAALAERLVLPGDRDRCVLLSFGGLGIRVEAALLERWPRHVFLGPDPALADAPNGRVLPAGVRPLDLMPLAGRMITKAGYSSFCEAFSQDVGIHLVHRRDFAEAPVLEEALRRHGRHRLLAAEAWREGDWQLDRPLLPPGEGPLPLDGAVVAAAALAERAEASGLG